MSGTQEKLVLLDPTLKVVKSETLSSRLTTLQGKTIGVIWNGRPPGDVMFDHVFRLLEDKYGIKRGPLIHKPYLGNVAPAEAFDELAETCDAVMTGVGDWGSCTSGSVLDAIVLERRGIPAAMIGAEKLVNTTGRGMAKLQGLPDFPLAIIAGFGLLESIRTDEDRAAAAAVVAAQVENILLNGRTG